jgi:hypothetical protein
LGRKKSAKIFMPLPSFSSTATAAKHLFTLNDSAAEFYVNSVVAERFFAPLWEQFAQARGRRECRELSDREWFVLGPRRRQDAELKPLLRAAFAQSRQPYASPRLRAELRALGQRVGKSRIARLMWDSGLCPRQKRRFRPITTDSRHRHKVADNWLAKVPELDRPGQICPRPPVLPCGQRLRPLAISLRSIGRATSPP